MINSNAIRQQTNRMFSAQLIAGPDVFLTLSEEEWNELANRGMTKTPFQQHHYQASWWRHLGEGDLWSVIVRSETGHLKGIAPLNLRGERVVFNGSKEESDYLDLIASAADAEGVWQAVFDCLVGDSFPSWNQLDFFNVPADSPSREILSRLAKDRAFVFSEELAEVCPVIDLGEDFESYLAGLDKKQRHEIRRKMRRANGAEAELVIVDEADDLSHHIDVFLDLLQKSTPEKEQWLTDGRRALFHDVARSSLAKGSLLLMFMKVGEEVIAGLFNFCYSGRIWVYNSGLDMSRHSRLSLGVVLTAEAIKYGVEKGYKTFDFLRGDEEYKYRFGAHDSKIFRLQIDKKK